MRIDFRQGIVSHDSAGFLNFNGTGGVDVLADNRAVTITIADRSSNYTFVEEAGVQSAWIGPFISATDYWLYWDLDTGNFDRTFGFTTIEPTFGANAPTNPAVGQIWFDTTNEEQFEFIGSTWTKVYRVFAAKLNSGQFASMSINNPVFTGTQIGITTSARSGRIIRNAGGSVVRKDDNTFFTTEDQFFVDVGSSAIRLESNVVRAKALESSMAAFTVVAFTVAGEIRTAQYEDAQNTICAILTENLTQNSVGVVVPQGIVANPAWDFSAAGVGTQLWIDNGLLVSVDPHVTDVIANPIPKTAVARVVSIDSVLFEQGLGGIGPRGPVGSITNLPAATTTGLGAVVLASIPTNPAVPIVVGDNDPRLMGGPFAPVSHNHPASVISFSPNSGLLSSNVQAAVEELAAKTAPLEGATFTGPVQLSGVPTTNNEAASKQYVDLTIATEIAGINTITNAADVVLAPFGNITATNSQAGFQELDANKVNRSGDTITGPLILTSTLETQLEATFQATTQVFGNLLAHDSLVVTNGDLTVVNNANISGTLVVSGATQFNSTLEVDDDTEINGNLDVLDVEAIDVDVVSLTAASDVTTAVLVSTDDTTLAGNLLISAPSTVTDVATFTDQVFFNSETFQLAAPTLPPHVANKQYVDDAIISSSVAELPYDITFFIAGPAAPVDGKTMGLIITGRNFRVEAGIQNVVGRALIPPAEVVVYNFVVENAIVGTITFDPAINGGIEPTFNIPAQVIIPRNAIVEIQPVAQETTIQDVAITITGCTPDVECLPPSN